VILLARAKEPMKGVYLKKGYWYARVEGKEVYCGKGSKGYKMAVAAKAKDIARQYENKEIGAGLKVKKVNFKTFAELIDWYLEQPSIQEQASYKRKLSGVKHLRKYFGKMRINQIQGTDQEQYRAHRKRQGVKDGTINFEIEVLSAAYNMALKDKKIQFDDKPGRFVFKFDHNPRRIITENEFQRLLEHSSTDLHDLFICGYESAMRSGEICGLIPEKVHLDTLHFSGNKVDYIDLGIFDTKNKTRRTVPVSPMFKKVLQHRLKDLNPGDFIFTQKGKKWTADKIAIYIKEACEKAKIPYGDKVLNKKGERIGIVFHCFRHTRITRWVEMGFSDEIIRRASGHKDLKSYRNYIKLDPHSVMRLVENQNRDKTATKLVRNP
jgi:integrase